MRNATSRTVATFGVVAGLAGIEHGVGELLQGNRAPDGLVIASWPDSELFRILAGEPAMTIIPNLRLSGSLAILVSLIFVVWATLFVQRRHGGLVLIFLSLVLLLVGGGFGPPLLGIIIGVAATRIQRPLSWLRGLLSGGAQRALGRLWPWSLAAAVLAWLALLPGSLLLDYLYDLRDPDGTVLLLGLAAFGLLFVTIVTGLVRDMPQRAAARRAPLASG